MNATATLDHKVVSHDQWLRLRDDFLAKDPGGAILHASSYFVSAGRPSTYTSSAAAIDTRPGPYARIDPAKNFKVRSASC
jgi:hypothetical protein